MIIGIPKEIKEHEYRVAVTPSGVGQLCSDGHIVLLEKSAGDGSGFSDGEYEQAGAEIRERKSLFRDSELIVKVKEPLTSEYELLHEGQALFTFLHLASNLELIKTLLKRKVTGFAYETLEKDGSLPLLSPMSEIAGKMAPVIAAYYLQKIHGGYGVLLTGASGVPSAKVLILGAGTVGMGALQVAHGMGADITVINRGEEKLRRIDELFGGKIKTLTSSKENIEREAVKADAIIAAVLVAGAETPKLISRDTVSGMKKGAVIVDVSVDQGGCIETTRPATHSDPVYEVGGVIHYTVTNMPGAFPRTSTLALTGRTIEYIRILAAKGAESSIKENDQLKSALNIFNGEIIHKAVADFYHKKENGGKT